MPSYYDSTEKQPGKAKLKYKKGGKVKYNDGGKVEDKEKKTFPSHRILKITTRLFFLSYSHLWSV